MKKRWSTSEPAGSCPGNPPPRQVWEQLAYLGHDAHPDAHACRLRLSLATLGCQDAMPCPWALPTELAACPGGRGGGVRARRGQARRDTVRRQCT